MISTLVCGAPAGIDGSGRIRVPAERWASLLTVEVVAAGGAMRQDVVPAAQAVPTGTPFGTTTPYSTLGNHSPGRPQS